MYPYQNLKTTAQNRVIWNLNLTANVDCIVRKYIIQVQPALMLWQSVCICGKYFQDVGNIPLMFLKYIEQYHYFAIPC